LATVLRPRHLVLLVSMALLGAACGGLPAVPSVTHGEPAPRPTAPVGAVVHLNYESFEPSVVTIHAGQAVEWAWGIPHVPDNVDIPGVASSPAMESGVWFHTFEVPGTYHYLSDFHQRMQGTVVVLP
jgi:plastocyanin